MSQSEKPKKNYGIKEIAEKANVSIATVDRVIHKRGGVAKKTEEMILKIIEEFDYQPNILASRLRSNKTYHLAVLIPQVSPNTDFWAAPLKGIEKAQKEISQFGVDIHTYFYALSDKTTFHEQAQKILKSDPDGVLIAPVFARESLEISSALTRAKIPVLFIDTEVDITERLSYIGPDIYKSGHVGGQLALYGIKNKPGNNEILVINYTSTTDDSHHIKEIERGFTDYVRESGSPVPVHVLDFQGHDRKNLEDKLLDFLKNHPAVSAIFVTNSRVFRIAEVIKGTPYEEVILIGFDFIEENIRYLKEDVIDFLICHKPEEQGYRGVMNLYQHLLLMRKIEKVQYMPIDIITRENYEYYSN